MEIFAKLKTPFITTGKSKIYSFKNPEGIEIIVKVLTNKSEPWKSFFIRELKIARKIESTRLADYCPRLLGYDLKKWASWWEKSKGKPLGVGRFFPESIGRRHIQSMLEAVEITRSSLRPAKGGLEFAHGDLVNSNILFSGKRLAFLDWEHAGLKPPFFDHAFLWVMGLFSKTHRNIILQHVEMKKGLSFFWENVAEISEKELRIHRGLKPGSLYKSDKSLNEIRGRLQDEYRFASAKLKN